MALRDVYINTRNNTSKGQLHVIFFISHLHYDIIYTVLCMYEINIVKCQKGIHDENDAFSRYKQQINFIALVTRVLRYQNMPISPSIYLNIKY